MQLKLEHAFTKFTSYLQREFSNDIAEFFILYCCIDSADDKRNCFSHSSFAYIPCPVKVWTFEKGQTTQKAVVHGYLGNFQLRLVLCDLGLPLFLFPFPNTLPIVAVVRLRFLLQKEKFSTYLMTRAVSLYLRLKIKSSDRCV